jgi:hypothetical protein
LRLATRALGIVLLVLSALPAVAEEFSACWVTSEFDPVFGEDRQVTRCRLAGGEIVDYASDTAVPSQLYPGVGTDLTGECWYLTSTVTQWVYVNRFIDGDAILGWDPDPSTPGGIALGTGRIPRCTSEPDVAVDPAVEVWEYVTSYIHPPPTPDLSPSPGDGVTGLETFIGLPIPDDHSTQLASATGSTLDVFIEVSGIIVDWGDGEIDSMPADSDAFAGFPTGAVIHVYEVKDETGYALAVSYDWTARWRVSGGVWEFLAVPNTSTSVDYPVAEIVSVITD